ncbi:MULTISPECIES: spore germination protein [Sutcliffiella]|uniref:Spore germination protein n=1 Tax=Sutcliffiella cohnii TaxID=33932 RepID=A0A223KLA2_9BACI|nr:MULTISPECIES: spore germination protein [Sutcliffiella]AST90144.1 spore germination protein [Sutcliffiella cohnii]WBL15795.1 spore germination protein [Sutcliffiella sp. NC1]
MIFFRKYKKMQNSSQQTNNNSQTQKSISSELMDNVTEIKSIFSDTPDLVIRHIVIKQTDSKAALIYLSGITDSQTIYNHVLSPLLFEENKENNEADLKVSLGHIKEVTKWQEIETAILNGECVLFVDEYSEAFIFGTPDFPKRSLEDSPLESTLSGAHVGFTESIADNIGLIRKQIRNRELKIKEITVGERGKSKVSILYLEDVANPEVLQELETRIQKVDVDGIINSGVLTEFIEDNSYSPFPQLLLTERPDFAASEILQGRIVTVVDRSPNVIIGPTTFDSFFRTMDDYGSRWIVASFVRLLRYFGFFIAILLPAFYIAIISFHFEVIPLKLLFSIGVSRERVPFPPYLEAFIMEFTLEMLREAGIRLPAKIGQTVGIVGGIVIGQAAVEAGVVSNIMVIVVAITAIASFIIPNYEMSSAIRIVRFPMMILATLFGFVGIVAGIMILIAHFISLESLGTPYSSPIAPLRFKDLKDVFIRFPVWSVEKRPLSTQAVQNRRANSNRPKGDEKG